MGVEREGEPYEQRVRQWLGSDESAFDVLLIAERTQGPTQFAYRATRHVKGNWDLMDEWSAHLEKLNVKNFVCGLLLSQGKESKRNAFSVRRQKGERSGAAEIQWLREWESIQAGAPGSELLLASRPRRSHHLELQVVHSDRHGELVPRKHALRIAYPFEFEEECPEWVATLVARCDGKLTARELLAVGKREHWIHPDTPDEEYARVLGGVSFERDPSNRRFRPASRSRA